MKDEFASDLNFANIIHAVLIRTDRIGIIQNISIPELPDGYQFFSAKDIPGKKEITILNYNIPVFAIDTIEFVGQVIGILVGADKSVLLELQKQFDVQVASTDDNLSEKNFYEYPILSERSFEFGTPEEIFADSHNSISSSLTFESRYHNRSETACVQVIHSKAETLSVYLATQWPYCVAETVSSVLGVPKDKIDINGQNFGEHLNSLVWFPALLACQCAVAAVLSDKNIALHLSRVEDYDFTTCSPKVIVKHTSVVSNFEKILATNISVQIDAGAFNPVIDEMILQMLTVAVSIYEIPNLHISVTAYRTHSKPTDFFGGLGENFVINALEKHMNEIANKRNISPVEFRLENINKENKKVGGKILLDDIFDFEGVLKDTCKASDYHRKYHAYKLLNSQTYNEAKTSLRGIGLATGLQYSGINSFIKRGVNYSVELTVGTDGKATVKIVDSNSELNKLFAKQISTQLGIDESNIKFVDYDEKDFNIIKTMENNVLYLTSLVQKCCDTMQKLRFRNPLPITVKKKFRVAKNKDWNPVTLEGVPFMSETAGACVVELELDPIFYTVNIKHIWLAAAPGAIFKKQAVIEKIRKEAQNCISQLTIENSSESAFSQYRILNIADAPSISVSLLQSDEKNAIYKGVENIANNLVPAAFASALEQIFLQNEELLVSVPITKEKIYNAILQMHETAAAHENTEQTNAEDQQATDIKTNAEEQAPASNNSEDKNDH